jgi:hypothetical protein
MVVQSNPVRAGIPKTLTLTAEAVEALVALTPSRKTMGRVVSQLLLAEVVRREVRQEERQRLKEGVLQVFEEQEFVRP